ncbi:hypothetical protein NGRA_1420 [Nosema granulosis]|uniref:Peptidase A2 domain-containing protein n=1 Tax=Nosema granulosis TaxID=83296 RepID=A0A9P6H174_9MICR|nr:hypothetical protein NGRA_1420 [Nosema granulosis]
MTEILNRERSRLGRRVERVEETTDMEKDNEIKECLYHFNRVETKGNPFFVTGTINGKQRKLLLDTGADVSLIDTRDFDVEENKLEAYKVFVCTTDRELLNILGKKNNIKKLN